MKESADRFRSRRGWGVQPSQAYVPCCVVIVIVQDSETFVTLLDKETVCTPRENDSKKEHVRLLQIQTFSVDERKE
jgi:hypothetical protein